MCEQRGEMVRNGGSTYSARERGSTELEEGRPQRVELVVRAGRADYGINQVAVALLSHGVVRGTAAAVVLFGGGERG